MLTLQWCKSLLTRHRGSCSCSSRGTRRRVDPLKSAPSFKASIHQCHQSNKTAHSHHYSHIDCDCNSKVASLFLSPPPRAASDVCVPVKNGPGTMQAYTELVAPSAVTHSLSLPLTSSSAENLVVAKGSLLQIFTTIAVSAEIDRQAQTAQTSKEEQHFGPGAKVEAEQHGFWR
jgi:hypothetical protein